MKAKLTIRDLFAVVTIVALGLGWAIDHHRQRRIAARNRVLQAYVDNMKAVMEMNGDKVTLRDNGMVLIARPNK